MSSKTYRYRKMKVGGRLTLSAARKKRSGESLAKWREEQRRLKIMGTKSQVEATSCAIEENPSTSDDLLSVVDEAVGDSFDDMAIAKEEKTQSIAGGVTGRRIIDLKYFIEQIQSIDHSPFSCSFKDLELLRERRLGLRSCLVFVCKICHVTEKIWTDRLDSNKAGVNFSAAAGVMSSGGGQSQLEDILTAMNIPSMTAKSFKKYHDKVCEGWEQSALVEMEMAAKTEASMAIEKGDVDDDGTPLITVVADGSWCKRSYRNNYSSLSGVGAIVGYNTKKILFIGVKNKYCTTCMRAATKKDNAPNHKCSKNWDSNKSSGAMEAAAIVEGFKRSEEMYGIRYSRLIADGDSSVYKKILDSKPYKNITVEKIECRNHILRNYCNKLKELVMKGNRETCDIAQRKLLGQNILRLRMAVVKAVHFRKIEDMPLEQKVLRLREDILNSPSHVFGEHALCKKLGYFCDGINPPDRRNEVPSLTMCGLYDRIMDIVQYTARHSRSLIFDVDNNAVEHYNSVVCKLIGGKRVNYALSGSYKGRCAGAVVSVNTGNPIHKLYKTVVDASPGLYAKKLLSERQTKNLRTKMRRKEVRSRRKLFNKIEKRDPDYGPASHQPDLGDEEIGKECQEFLKSLKINAERREAIERATVLQRDSVLWMEMRRKTLTASNFGRVCKMRPYTGCENILKSILYIRYDSEHLQYGRNNEERARLDLEKHENVKILPCGLFIDEDIPYLGASPDGIIENNGLVEIKCPSSAAEMNPEEAIRSGKVTFWDRRKDMAINKSHNFYYQIQGQLHITRREYCLFALWTPRGMKVEKINRDDKFWSERMEEKLKVFYTTCMLPELVDPRYPRCMPIRNPPAILDAQEVHSLHSKKRRHPKLAEIPGPNKKKKE